MKRKLTLDKVLCINDILKRLIDNKELKVTPSFKFKLLSIMKLLEPHVINFEYICNEKIKEYGKENKDKQISISQEDDPESFEKYSKDISELLSSTVKIETVNAEDVFDKGVPAEALVTLYDLISE